MTVAASPLTLPDRTRSERASALVLVPALVLVLIVLGSLAVDVAVAHAVQRDLSRSLSAAADDAAAMIDQRRLQTDGTVRLDEEAARRVVRAHLGVLVDELGPGADGADHPRDIRSCDVVVTESTVTIRVVAEVPRVFLSALPDVADTSTVQVVVTGRLQP
jgi:hypothetical protein